MKLTNGDEATTSDELIGRPISQLDTPVLLLDAAALEANVAAMARLVADRRVVVRPHTKTHKSSRVAAMQQTMGATGFCCAKLGEAEVLAAAGMNDLMITTPLRGRAKLERLSRLLRGCNLSVLADDLSAVAPLAAAASRASTVLNVIVEVDVGQNRCGVRPGGAALPIAREVLRHPSLRFRGLQGYQGLLQGLRPFAERRKGARRALDRLLETATILRRAGIDVPVLTGGGTGTLIADLEYAGLTELQPGSYVFMDTNYRAIGWDDAGSPPPFRCALTILTGVVSNAKSDKVVVDCGWKAASCDAGPPVVKDRTDLVFAFAGDEHGLITRPGADYVDLQAGNTVELIPSHCDTTVNLFDRYVVHRNGRVEAVWSVDARGRTH